MNHVSANGSCLKIETSDGYHSWPMINTLGKRLVCIYSSGTAHWIAEPCRKVFSRYSDDGGLHWSKASLLVDSRDCGDVPIGKGTDEKGALLFWIRCVGEKDFRHELYRSEDGISFQRITVFRGDPVPMQITDVFPVPGNGLMCLWFSGSYGQDARHNAWGTLTSSDNGITWEQHVAEKDLPKNDWPTEPSAVLCGGGRILAVARTESYEKDKCQYQLQSEDSGRTWKRYRTNIRDVTISTPSLLYDAETGKVCCYYYQRGAGLLKRRTAALAAVWDHPLCWPEPETLFYGSRSDEHAGNVNACLWNGCHAAAFYSGNRERTAVLACIFSTSLS